jgi:hypothetical protein
LSAWTPKCMSVSLIRSLCSYVILNLREKYSVCRKGTHSENSSSHVDNT